VPETGVRTLGAVNRRDLHAYVGHTRRTHCGRRCGAGACTGQVEPGRNQTGKCSAAASWKLKAKLDDGLIEAEFEVDQNIAGRRWNIVITRDGATVFRGARITRPPSGSFTVGRRIRSSAGSDRIVAKATAARGGQVCRGVVTI
jgi:hypothetical protein